MEPPNKRHKSESTHILALPQAILVRIFEELDFKSVCSCAIVCRTFRDVSNEAALYKTVTLQQDASNEYLKAYVTKISYVEDLTIIYKKHSSQIPKEDCAEFEGYIVEVLQRFSRGVKRVAISNCRSETILKMVFECQALTKASFKFCKGYNAQLQSTSLTYLHFEMCDIPSSILVQILKDNPNLKRITLVNNINLHTNGIAKILGNYNLEIEDIRFIEKRRVRARGIESFARCNKLKSLSLGGSPFQCDPENSFEQLAAGCPLLERLSIHGWKGITDDKLLPILQSCTQLRYLDFRGIDVTIKSCREAALSLPLLLHMDFVKCERIKRNQLQHLQKDFPEIDIVVY